MKKRILKIAFVIAVVAISSYNVLNSRSETVLSDLLMDNVEALAQGEVSVSGCQPNGGTCVISFSNTIIIKDNQHP